MISVAIVTNGRCPPLLEHCLQQWQSCGADFIQVIGPADAFRASHCNPRIVRHHIVRGVSMAEVAPAYGLAMSLVPAESWCVMSADDILPLDRFSPPGTGWLPEREPAEGAIYAARLLDVEGRRYFDWAYSDEHGSHLQDYAEWHPRTYITGGAQVWGPHARTVVSYTGRDYSGDVSICIDATEKGVQLVAPAAHAPLLIHLERRYPLERRRRRG